MHEHEYVLLGGVNRAKIGRYLGTIAALISAAIVFCLLALVDLANKYNIPTNLPPSLLSLAGAGTIFAILYWLFDRYIWRWPKLGELLKVPNLEGQWHCIGTSINPDRSVAHDWSGTVTITQSWDKLRVRLKTKQSGSNSIVAALVHDKADGYHLIYNYRNDPKIGETHLKSHLGFSDMTFSKDQLSADGEYFNGHGRFTFGTMKWTRQ